MRHSLKLNTNHARLSFAQTYARIYFRRYGLLMAVALTSGITAACGRVNSPAETSAIGDAAVSFAEFMPEYIKDDGADETPVRIPPSVDEAPPAGVPGISPPASPPPPPADPELASTPLAPNPEGVAIKDFERKVIELTNAERQKFGLAILKVSPHLLNNCRQWAGNMASRRSMYHSNMDFGGENIAWNQSSPEEVVTSWMNSPGHRANILRTGFRSIGVSMVSSNGPYWCQQFGW